MDRERENAGGGGRGKIDEREIDVNLISVVEPGRAICSAPEKRVRVPRGGYIYIAERLLDKRRVIPLML